MFQEIKENNPVFDWLTVCEIHGVVGGAMDAMTALLGIPYHQKSNPDCKVYVWPRENWEIAQKNREAMKHIGELHPQGDGGAF